MTQTYVDTHVIIWLRENRLGKISKTARRELESAERLFISPIVKLELHYLQETGRLTLPADIMLDSKTLNFEINLSDMSFTALCEAAKSQSWTRDLFDRFIVAEAAFHRAKLITADHKIHEHYKKALW